jgi:hypothetical protein
MSAVAEGTGFVLALIGLSLSLGSRSHAKGATDTT